MSIFVEEFGMSSEEVARLLTETLGETMRIKIIKEVARQVGVNKVAEVASTSPSVISNTIKRGSIGSKLSKKVFKGLAEAFPHVLRFAVIRVLKEYQENLKKIDDNLKELEEILASS